jgi:hypothetical protein
MRTASTDDHNESERMGEMHTNRIQLLGAVGLVVAFGFAGSTGAATGTSGASASEAWQGTVSIRCMQGVAIHRGPFTLSVVISLNGSRWRVISDRGRCVDREGPSGPRDVRILFGTKGTIWMTVGAEGPGPFGQHWRITKATKAYAGLRGRGRASVHREVALRDITMKGTVWQ